LARILIVSHYARSLLNFRGELIKSMVGLGHEVFAAAPEEGFEEKLKALGASYLRYPLRRTGLNPLQDLGSLLALIRMMRKIEPDVVLSYAIKPVIYGSLAARLAGVKRVFSMITGLGFVFVNGGAKQKVLRRVVGLMYRAAFKGNRAVFFQNPDDEQLIKEMGIIGGSPKTVLINGSGVDTERYYYVPVRKEPLSFLLIARLIWDKGIREYAEAARMLKSRYPEVAFSLLGPYDSNPAAIKPEDVEGWVEEGVIEYLGETDDVRPYLADAGVYVLPSYREGTPRSVLEAMSMGRPVITTDAPGCRETVEDGVNGFLVPVRDAEALAGAMEKFIQNPELIGQMGAQSRKIAEEKYDVHKVNKVILSAMGL
jgi:glycosyltransferase involved in cell wall biosynthesis